MQKNISDAIFHYSMNEKSKKEALDSIFDEIRQYYDQMDIVREKLLPLQRQTVRICSEIIKSVHRNESENLTIKIASAQENLKSMQAALNDAPGSFTKDYLQIVKQELGEAVIFYHLISTDSIPTPADCGIDLEDYGYACADVVGEIRRYILKCLRKNEFHKAVALLEDMSEIYNYLFTLDYPNGLIPGLRKKIDVARGILTRTEADVTLAQQMHNLNESLNRQN